MSSPWFALRPASTRNGRGKPWARSLRLPVSTRQFDYFVERLRGAFLPEEQHVREVVFHSLDEGGMDFISAEALNESEFTTLCSAVERAHQGARSEEAFPVYQPLWDELLTKIHADPRGAD